MIRRVRDDDPETEDDEEEQQRETTIVAREAGAVGEQLYSSISEQVERVQRLHTEEVKGLVAELRSTLARAEKAEEATSSGSSIAERAKERAEADLAVVLEDFGGLEEEVLRIKARQRKHEVVGKMQGLFARASLPREVAAEAAVEAAEEATTRRS